MDLAPRRSRVAGADYSWLASAHATENARSVTIDFATLTKGTHYPDGYLPSGLPLGKLASGKYGPYDNGKSNGQETFERVLLEPLTVTDGDVSGAAIWHGAIYNDRLPIPLDSAGLADAKAGLFHVIEEGGS